MGACRASLERRIEVQLESRVFFEAVVRNLENVDFVIAFEMDDAGGIFIQEVICDH